MRALPPWVRLLAMCCALVGTRPLRAAALEGDGAVELAGRLTSAPEPSAGDEGIRFICPPASLPAVEAAMAAYQAQLGIPEQLVVHTQRPSEGILVYTLASALDDTATVDFKSRPELAIPDDVVSLPQDGGMERRVDTVSRKEILLALLQHGRLTDFRDDACSVEALADHVEVRRNIVAWAEQLAWGWPDGQAATWNLAFWEHGTPKPGAALTDAVADVFHHQDKYAFGCYTATKIAVVQGILDHYARVKNSPELLAHVQQRLLTDNEPLVDVEPGRMWSFEADFNPTELSKPGKVLQIQYGVAPLNFVPGDWVYFLNTDEASRAKTGYEGSNAIYLGRGRFDDYYADNNHAFTYEEKLDEVFQWRHGVINRVRDADKRVALSPVELAQLGRTPAEGGVMMDLRVFPQFFLPAAGGEK